MGEEKVARKIEEAFGKCSQWCWWTASQPDFGQPSISGLWQPELRGPFIQESEWPAQSWFTGWLFWTLNRMATGPNGGRNIIFQTSSSWPLSIVDSHSPAQGHPSTCKPAVVASTPQNTHQSLSLSLPPLLTNLCFSFSSMFGDWFASAAAAASASHLLFKAPSLRWWSYPCYICNLCVPTCVFTFHSFAYIKFVRCFSLTKSFTSK